MISPAVAAADRRHAVAYTYRQVNIINTRMMNTIYARNMHRQDKNRPISEPTSQSGLHTAVRRRLGESDNTTVSNLLKAIIANYEYH